MNDTTKRTKAKNFADEDAQKESEEGGPQRHRRAAVKPPIVDDEEDEDVKPQKKQKTASLAKSNARKRRRDEPEEEEEAQEEEEEGEDPNGVATGEEGGEDDVEPEEEEEEEDEDEDDDDEDGDNDPDADEDDARPKKKRASTSRGKTTSSAPKSSTSSRVHTAQKKTASRERKGPGRETKLKEMSKLARIEEAIRAFKWWEAEELPEGTQWRTLEHNGVNFCPPYVPHGVPLTYDGKPVALTPAEEEVASFYASIPDDGPQLGNADTRKVFQNNFFSDFQKILQPGSVIKKFEKCDFGPIKAHLEQQRAIKKAASNAEKSQAKAEKERLQAMFGFALVDGRIEKLGNFNMEPPSLFRGRGKHPLTGTLKRRVMPEQVTLNLAESCPVPKCAVPGHAWAGIQHDASVTWMSSWRENVLGSNKYVMLAASSSFKGKSDMQKYSKAIRLKACIERIRADYTKKLKSKIMDERQMGTAMWVIDVLALRVGGEKGEDEADTVGCCSLRREHMKLLPGEDVYEIDLEFLGKDSMQYKQRIDLAKYGDIGQRVYENLKSFCTGKKSSDDIFDRLTPTTLNAHLTSLMRGLTAKVFRTYNASETLQNELPDAEDIEELSFADKVLAYNKANREVAILCNHQRTVTKGLQQTLDNLSERLELLRQQKRELQAMKKHLAEGNPKKIKLISGDTEASERAKEAKERADKLKQEASTADEKLKATAAIEEAKTLKLQLQKQKLAQAHLFSDVPREAQVEKRIEQWDDKIRKVEIDLRNRDENKEVALGTSKINYMDPRITVAWCKRCEVPIERIFAKTLRDKFNWAMAVPPDWKFE